MTQNTTDPIDVEIISETEIARDARAGEQVVVRRRGGSRATRTGIGLGGLLAVLMSWTVNKSIAWAIVHFFLSWIYVFYAACAHGDEIERGLNPPPQEGSP